RVLQEGTFYPVGGREQVRIDVRLVSATNADLPGRVAQGQFREDLYYRIKGITLHTTPLDDRTEDIALLCEHILEHWSERPGALRARLRLSPEARQWFVEHRWPGNVRELRNTLESVAAVCQGDLITPDDIRLLYPDEAPAPHAPLPGLGVGTLDDQVRALEIRLIRNALAAHQGNRSQAARALGLSRQGLLKKLARYHLQ
ncbi:MAG: sigma 54-interacting transcriptional regulator, partial [Gammaproteobacteria bacterium]|nr:sigma 54-interacting transcriptional regulator [Gammaproteobacteria bacterium]